MELKIVCENEKYLPEYANSTDACMDLKVRLETPATTIQPNETRVFGTGVQVAIPEDYVMLIYPRSSTGIKLHCMLANSTGVIDAGYRDEIKMAITNFGSEPVEITDGQRLAQFLVIHRPKLELNLVQDDDSFRQGDRGGGVGSTGK